MLGAIGALLLCCAGNAAAEGGSLVGMWKLVSYITADPDSGEKFGSSWKRVGRF
jgi:hypothetical protein